MEYNEGGASCRSEPCQESERMPGLLQGTPSPPLLLLIVVVVTTTTIISISADLSHG